MNETKVKPIVLTDEDGNKYTLEFNRVAVRFAESKGFMLEEVSKYPVTRIPELFYYAFYMHHRGISKAKTDSLYDSIGELPEGFLERLVNLYAEVLTTLMQGDGSKNGKVSVEL